MGRLATARSAPEADRGAMVAEALCTYVADRIGVPPAGFMRGDAITALEQRGIDESLVEELDHLISACEHLQYAGGSGTDSSTMIDSARTLVGRLEAASLSRGARQGARS